MKGSLLRPLLGSVSLPWDSFSWSSQEREGKSTPVGELKARKLKCEWFHPGVKRPSGGSGGNLASHPGGLSVCAFSKSLLNLVLHGDG